MRIGVFGGTFDPIHLGHLVAANEARFALDLDEVLLVVANEPWQKSGLRNLTPASIRLAMVEAAVAGHHGLVVCDLEIRRGGPSYTIDTLEELARRHPQHRLDLILGDDALAGFDTWERRDQIGGLARLVGMSRLGTATPSPPTGVDFLRLAMPRVEISSSDIRLRVNEGRPIDFLTPAPVVELIRIHHLYRPIGYPGSQNGS